ncbi:hypothetical protein CL634_07255 [bacterium]|nr:hypothetical protein [bacterium]
MYARCKIAVWDAASENDKATGYQNLKRIYCSAAITSSNYCDGGKWWEPRISIWIWLKTYLKSFL